jgi:hypothetical protein
LSKKNKSDVPDNSIEGRGAILPQHKRNFVIDKTDAPTKDLSLMDADDSVLNDVSEFEPPRAKESSTKVKRSKKIKKTSAN